MKRVAYRSPYVPAEWIAAHGLAPSRIIPTAATVAGPIPMREGVCSFMRTVVNELCAGGDTAGIVLTTVCDQIRRAKDLLRGNTTVPVFLFNVPATAHSVASQRLFLAELKRLGRWLQLIGGSEPSDAALADVMRSFDKQRSELRALRGAMDARLFSEAIVCFNRTGRLPEGTGTADGETGVPVALVGGPLAQHDFELIDLVRAAGGKVVLDGSETGERTLPRPFDLRRLEDDPLMQLADAYYARMPDVFRRPNTALYEWLAEEVKGRGIRGVILTRYVWCDCWHAEVQRIREWLDVPVLDIDLDAAFPVARFKTRLAAFVETLG